VGVVKLALVAALLLVSCARHVPAQLSLDSMLDSKTEWSSRIGDSTFVCKRAKTRAERRWMKRRCDDRNPLVLFELQPVHEVDKP
jgi:hypothetical protein